MRVPHALAAVAAFGALVYGIADPLSSAMSARNQANESRAVASQAQAAARVKVAIPGPEVASSLTGTKPKRKRPTGSKPPVAAKAPTVAKAPVVAQAAVVAKAAPSSTVLHATEPDLSDIAQARDQHRSSAKASTPAVSKARAPRAAITHRQPAAKPATTPTAGPRRSVVRTVDPVTPRVVAMTESYGPSSSQRVTISRLNTATGKRPTVYFVHGGSWIGGNRDEWQGEANRWAAKGWTAVNISYRVNVQGRLMLSDVRTVVSDFEERPYVDGGKQIIVGSSAGGHLATSIAVRYPKEFRGVIAWSPVISPEVAAEGVLASTTRGGKYRLAQAARRLWGSNWHSATPVSYVSGDTPPLWAAAATGEWLRWSDQGELLCDALGRRCTANLVPGASHGARLAQSHPVLRERALKWAMAQVA